MITFEDFKVYTKDCLVDELDQLDRCLENVRFFLDRLVDLYENKESEENKK